MADEEHLKVLLQGVPAWNDWRERNPVLQPDLRGVDLRGVILLSANLSRADLREADLRGASLNGADLEAADLRRANLASVNLSGANLRGTKLTGAQLIGTNLRDATLTGSYVYGVSVWDIIVSEGTIQQNLIITDYYAPAITVDNIEVAQFIHLLLNNQAIRKVIETITSKAVLILGRFSDGRKVVLDALRDALRDKGFLPIVFDFERPQGRDFTETVKVLAGMSCFVIADITNPRSAPLELQATVPDYMIPFVPILQEGEPAFAMLSDLQTKYDWALVTRTYNSCQELIEFLDDAVINPALEKRHELEVRKVQTTPARRVSDYRKH
jgi:hypothetical protein